MSEVLALTAVSREKFGTGEARALRKTGMVPAIIYGNDKKPLAVAITEKEITKHYRKPGFKSTVIQLEVGGKKHKVLPKAVDLHPVTDIVRHVDFVLLGNATQNVEVLIVFDGKERSIGVKRGGFFNIVRRYVMLLCPVNSIPKNVIIDVTSMLIGQSIKVTDLQLPIGCELMEKSSLIVASVIGSKGDKGDAEEKKEPAAADAKAPAATAAAAVPAQKTKDK